MSSEPDTTVGRMMARQQRLAEAVRAVARGPHGIVRQGASVECYRCGASATWDDEPRRWVGSLDRSCR